MVVFEEGVWKVTDDFFVAERFRQIIYFHDFLAKTWGLDIETVLFIIVNTLFGNFFYIVECFFSFFRFVLSCLRLTAHPFEFNAVFASCVFYIADFEFFTFGFLYQKVAIIPFVSVKRAVVKFQDSITYVVNKISVVGDEKQCDFFSFEMFFKPFNHSNIKMIGGLVKKQHVAFIDEDFCKGKPFLLSAWQIADCFVEVRNFKYL